ncbi:MAG: hypothetical protein HJJLKODD_03014 [Phycisphaerae bacterium]|nr:hypothetical protein [Phycisphaerae bacterium]
MHSLVIDDEFVSLSKMVIMLEPLGHCDAATNGHQALSLFRQALEESRPYVLVTIDINMPDINGLMLLESLRLEEQKHVAPPAKKLIITADSSTLNVMLAVNKNCDGFLVKPVRQSVLIEKLTALKLIPGINNQSNSEKQTTNI